MGLFSLFKRKKTEPVPDEPVQTPSLQEDMLEADEVHGSIAFEFERDNEIRDLWHDSPESLRRHSGPAPTAEVIAQVEDELGYRLPQSYIALMLTHNGGLVNRCRFRVPAPAEGCPDTIYITEILGIGREVPYSLCGRFGSEFLIDSRRHKKDIGIAICNTTLPGRALVFLDYRACGRTGEPCVTWADAVEGTELPLARNFAEFVKGLEANTVGENDP